jgi:hypothetical protein
LTGHAGALLWFPSIFERNVAMMETIKKQTLADLFALVAGVGLLTGYIHKSQMTPNYSVVHPAIRRFAPHHPTHRAKKLGSTTLLQIVSLRPLK